MPLDPLTHLLAGLLVALAVEPMRARAGNACRASWLSAGAVAGVLPDLAHLPRVGDPQAVLASAGLWTHSLLALPVLALALAALFAWIARRPRQWPVFLFVTGPALLVHLGADLVTASGIRPWYPVAESRYAVPLLFPLDLWITAVVTAAVIVAWRRPMLGRWAALAAFAATMGYLVLLWQWRAEALDAGAAVASHYPSADAHVHAFPQPFSPRNWQVLVAHGDAFDLAWLKVGTRPSVPVGTAPDKPRDGSPEASTNVAAIPGGPSVGEPLSVRSALARLSAAYAEPAQARWIQVFRFGDEGGRAEFARTAWSRPEFAGFRRFSVYTVLSHVEYRADVRLACAWFYDARFAWPGVAPSYRFGSCQHLDDSTWSVQRAPGPLPLL